MNILTVALFVYALVLTILFVATAKRMESTSEQQLEEIKALVGKIKPEKIRVEVDSSPWSLSKTGPIEEDEALMEMWEALNRRGIVGDHAERIAHLFGWEDYNRAPLSDGRTVVWYGNQTPEYIRNMLNKPYIIESEDDDYLIAH
jgi:hypothetical protein